LHPPIKKGNVIEAQRVSPQDSWGLMRSFHHPGSLKRLMIGGLIDMLIGWLLGESFFKPHPDIDV
jgi:hypothetical protein